MEEGIGSLKIAISLEERTFQLCLKGKYSFEGDK
jgi:hypothetical protein